MKTVTFPTVAKDPRKLPLPSNPKSRPDIAFVVLMRISGEHVSHCLGQRGVVDLYHGRIDSNPTRPGA
jgi:hypothetical protein